MDFKPELIVISQNLMGGGSSFHRNMIANKPDDYFDIKCIYLDPLHWEAKRLEDVTLGENDLIFKFEHEREYDLAKRLNNHISNKKGALIANLPQELLAMSYFHKSNKTIYFICHDKGFLHLIEKYSYLIDVFIAHNAEIYENIKTMLPKRINDIHFIQHGVKVQKFKKERKDKSQKLNLVFLARHVKLKGIYDLPIINQKLLEKNIEVNWTILGDGEEKENFKNEVRSFSNFRFETPKTDADVLEVLKTQDLYILPSSHDGLPVSLLESMSVGCVPIVYNFSEGIKKVITPEIGYVVDLHDINGMTDKIEILNNDRDFLFDLSKNALQKVEEEFNIKIQAEKYFDLYKDWKNLKKTHKAKRLTLFQIEQKYQSNKIVAFSFRVYRYLKKKFK
ncbi:glycosyltransferase family 4 protein [Flavobacterium defluvii]|uniref:Glycosyl transferases group 1 n=1 Tax=Flavobacterium defluvii TaxID=370979 RepID=A0A1M5NUY2_9FLAO|nr:glycosyltransferase family 4 protein [Flavobacterium defluvii]SHG93307.1 Glycosyl transferases group 1 [Flavobacterium defluvii]